MKSEEIKRVQWVVKEVIRVMVEFKMDQGGIQGMRDSETARENSCGENKKESVFR